MNIRWQLILSTLIFSAPALAGAPLQVHEWGTFTSYQNESGQGLYGLQRGDAALPEFVYLRNPTNPTEPSHSTDGCRRNSYSCDWAPISEPVGTFRLGVNQRMETPVIYFYSDVARPVEVKVDFPQGIITEWFPRSSSFVPAIGQVQQIAGGSMTWNVQVHTDKLALPPVPASSIWAPSRKVHANDISVDGENERLIFYRGVGDFATDFHASALAGTFQLNNGSAEEVPEVIYLHVTSEGGFARSLGPIAPGSTLPAAYGDTSGLPLQPMNEYLENASGLLNKILRNAGLFDDEANALIGTWKHAYFETKGERFLYILPRQWTDHLLPMTIKPAPDRLERVLVGRVEVMNLQDQETLHGHLFADANATPQAPLFTGGLGPFAEQELNLMLNRNQIALEDALEHCTVEQREQVASQYNRTGAYIQGALDSLQ